MIELTKYAAMKVQEIAEEEGMPPIIRAKVQGGGCAGFTYDLEFVAETSDADEKFECYGVTVVVDPVSFQYLDNCMIDYEDHKLGSSGFKFLNPNSKGSCGCGSSFSV